jgi:DNA-binding NarL/FixJ family response regulator
MRPKTNIPAEHIAQLIAEGKANKEIAERLGKSKRTIDDYIHRLLRRNGCRNRAQLAVKILGVIT